MTFNWLHTIVGILCPYRRHLEEEIDYLRAQLAQRQRRIDELQEALIDARTPAPKGPRPEPKPLPPAKPRGWSALRATHREPEQPSAEESA